MRYVFLSFAVVLVGASIWLFATHSISLLADRLHTVTVRSWSPQQFSYTTGVLEIGPDPVRLWLLTPEIARSTASASLSARGRVALLDSGKSFPMGPGRASVARAGLPEFEFAPDAGDTVQFSIERSMLSWPTPFETNFMTGVVPHWKRNSYVRLRWRKRSGAALEMLWRVEQSWYTEGGWRPPEILIVTQGLLPVRIEEATGMEQAAVQYLSEKKHWDRSDYQLEFCGPTADGREERVFALHRDEEHSAAPGAGKSVELRIGYESRKVTREIGGQ